MLVLATGFIASVFIVIGAFSLNRKTIIMANIFTNVFAIIQFFQLNQFGTIYLLVVSLVYTLLLIFEGRLPFVRSPWMVLGLILVQAGGFVVLSGGIHFTWELAALTGSVIGGIALWLKNPLHLKMTMLIMGFVWLSYQLASGAYGQVPGEFVFLTGIIFSIVMLSHAKKNGVPYSEVEELPMLIRKKLANRKKPSLVEPIVESASV